MELSVKQASIKAKVSQPTIRKWIHRGLIQATKQGRTWLVDEHSLTAYLRSRKPSCQNQDNDMAAEIARQVVSMILPVIQGENTGQTNRPAGPNVEEFEELKKENQTIKQEVSNLRSEIEELRNVIAHLQKENEKKYPTPKYDREEKAKPAKNELADEQAAERWAREHLEEWLEKPAPFKKAAGRSWKDLAENRGERIPMNGKGLNPPRAYLHSLENWTKGDTWTRIKAKVALEVCSNN